MKNTLSQIQKTIIVPEIYAGHRLDQALAQLFPEHSRSRLQNWIKKHQITVNNKYWRPSERLQGGETLIIQAQAEIAQNTWEAQPLPLQILYEDETVLVINKSIGLVTHPAAGNYSGTLANALLHHAPSLHQLPRAGIVHRLDKDTSGLLIIAKTLEAHTHLIKQLQERTIKREYYAVINGVCIAGNTINAPIGRHSKDRKKMAVVESGKSAITHYRVLERYRAHTLVRVFLETGRTHQIRVHMAHHHHPLIGDNLYGGRLLIPANASSELIYILRNFKRQALHAIRLTFVHPATQETIQVEAPLPEDMENLLAILRGDIEKQN